MVEHLSNIFSRLEWPMTLTYGVKHPVASAAVRSKAVVLFVCFFNVLVFVSSPEP